MAELDFEPFATEAFPGLEFYLTGDRDHLTLNSIETSSERHLTLLSLARQGYIRRYGLPGDFTPIPPRDGGLIPLEGQPGLAAPRDGGPARIAVRPMRIPDPPHVRDPHPAPAWPEVRFAPNRDNTPVRLRRGDEGIYLETYVGFGWRKLFHLQDETGRIFRWRQTTNQKRYLRHAGFCMSRDAAIAISNPQLPGDRIGNHPAVAAEGDEEPLHQEGHGLELDARMPEIDRVFAVREEMIRWSNFMLANAAIIRNLPCLIGHFDNAATIRGIGAVIGRLTEAHNVLTQQAAQPQGGGEGDPTPEGFVAFDPVAAGYLRGDDGIALEARAHPVAAGANQIAWGDPRGGFFPLPAGYEPAMAAEPYPMPPAPLDIDVIEPWVHPQRCPTEEQLIDFNLDPETLAAIPMPHCPPGLRRLVTFQRADGEDINGNAFGAFGGGQEGPRYVWRTIHFDTRNRGHVCYEPRPWNREILGLYSPEGPRGLVATPNIEWGTLFHCLEITAPGQPTRYATLTTALLRSLRRAVGYNVAGMDMGVGHLDDDDFDDLDIDIGAEEDLDAPHDIPAPEPDDGIF